MANYFRNIFKTSCLLLVVSGLLFGCGDTATTVTSITLSPSSATIGINKTQLFTAYPKNSLGQIISATVTWSVTGEGSISTTGYYTAGANSGEGYVYVTTGSVTTAAIVTVTKNGWIAGRIYDSAGKRVPDMKVYINSSLFDFSDSGGDYSIENVPAGTYEVWTTETQAYRAASKEAMVTSGETTIKNFTILYFTDPVDTTPPEFNI